MATRKIGFSIEIDGLNETFNNLSEFKKVVEAIQRDFDNAEFGSDKYKELSEKLATAKDGMAQLRAEQKREQDAIKAARYPIGSYNALNAELVEARKNYKNLSAEELQNAAATKVLVDRIQELDSELKKQDAAIGNFQRNVGNYPQTLMGALGQAVPQLGQLREGITAIGSSSTATGKLLTTAFVAAPIIAGAGAIASQLLDVNAEFGEVQKNLKKSTGLTSEAVTSLTDSLAQLDTRTSLKDLLAIATEGGKAGIQGEKGILAYTAAVDKLAVSLGDDFGGSVDETTSRLIKLSNAFFGTTTNGEELSGNLLSIGNALNVLADSGNASAENLTDFANRVGPLAKSLGLTEGQILGTGAALEELGVNAEIGASAFSNILNQITGNTTKFAQTLGLDVAKFKQQVNTDLFGAFQTVIAKVKELGPENTKTAETLKALGLNSNEVQRAFAALSNGQELLTTRTKQATDALKSQDKVNNEFAASNDTLQGSLDKLGKKFTEIQRSEGIGKLFKTIIDGATMAIDAIDRLLSSKLFDASTFIGPAGNIANIYNIITGKATEAEEEAKLAEENQKKRIDTFFELRKEADEKDITMTQAKTDRLFNIKRKEGADLLEQQFTVNKEVEAAQATANEALTKEQKAAQDKRLADKAAYNERLKTLERELQKDIETLTIAAMRQGKEKEVALENQKFNEFKAIQEKRLKGFEGNDRLRLEAETNKLVEAEREKHEARLLEIEQRNDNLSERLATAQATRIIEIDRQKEEAIQATAGQSEAQIAAQREQYAQQRIERKQQTEQPILDISLEAANGLMQIYLSEAEERVRIAAEAEAAQQQRISETEAQRNESTGLARQILTAQLAQEKEQAKQLKENRIKEERDLASKRKAIAVIQSVINGALAVTAQLAQGNIAGAIAAGVISAVQTAVIVAQPLAEGGMVMPYENINGRITKKPNAQTSAKGDNTLIYAKSGEVVLNADQQARAGGPAFFGALGVPGFPRFSGNFVPQFPNVRREAMQGDNSRLIDAMQAQTAALLGLVVNTNVVFDTQQFAIEQQRKEAILKSVQIQ